MKCRYGDNCKFDGEVKKEESIKEGTAYYHKECLEEKKIKVKIEEYYLENMPQTTMSLLRKVIKQLIRDKGYEASYVLYVCEWIVKNRKPIRVPFGLINYCTNDYIYQEWNKKKINLEYKKMQEEKVEIENCDTPSFSYKPTSKKKITDLI